VEQLEVIGEAQDGDSAMKLFDETHPDALVLDLGIPGKSGYEVLLHVKTGDPDAVVMILTNHSDPFARDRCRAEGADFFLDKVTEFESVVPIFTRLVEQRK
jgi:DNA-binding NarL/FixJ family response regulator